MTALPGLGALQGMGETVLRPATLISDAFHQRSVLADTGTGRGRCRGARG